MQTFEAQVQAPPSSRIHTHRGDQQRRGRFRSDRHVDDPIVWLAPPDRRTVGIVELGEQLNLAYQCSKGPELIDLSDTTAPSTVAVTYALGSEAGPLKEFSYKPNHTPREQDEILELAREVADQNAPSGDGIVVATHLSFWSDWTTKGHSYVGLRITYWLCEATTWLGWPANDEEPQPV